MKILISLPLVDQFIGKRIPRLAFHNVGFGLFVGEGNCGHLRIDPRWRGHRHNFGSKEWCLVVTHRMVNDCRGLNIFKNIRICGWSIWGAGLFLLSLTTILPMMRKLYSVRKYVEKSPDTLKKLKKNSKGHIRGNSLQGFTMNYEFDLWDSESICHLSELSNHRFWCHTVNITEYFVHVCTWIRILELTRNPSRSLCYL